MLDRYKSGESPTTLITDLAKTDNSTPEEYIPRLNTQTWQEAFAEHQEKVKYIVDDVNGNYVITKENELLVFKPHALSKALDRIAKQQEKELPSDPQLVYLLQNDLTIGDNSYEILVLNGKLFVNQRRVYDADLLIKCSDKFGTLDDESILKLISNSVESNDEDRYLIAQYRATNKLPGLFIFRRSSNPLSSLSDLSQRQSFQDVRRSTNTSGQMNIDGHVSDLPIPLFVTFDSLPSDTHSKLSSLAFKMGSHYFGTVLATSFDKTPLSPKHFESSVVYGFSFNNTFIEGQFGSFSDTTKELASVNGQRYQMTLGYDTEYITPFLRVLNRSANTQSLTQFGAGIESGLDKFKFGDLLLDAKVSLSYLGNNSGYSTGYLSSMFKATFSEGSSVGFSNDYDSINGMSMSLSFTFDR